MIKQTLYAVLCLICCTGNNLFAQEGSSAAGGDGAGSGGTISYTVGQTNYITLAGAGGTAMEGVQQPFEFSDPCDGVIAEITAGGPTTFCKLDSVILTISNLEPGDSYSWFKNGNMIPGAAGSDFAAMHTGDYTAQVITDGGCYIMSNSISVTADP
ncbi:MAG: hypothetical protein H7X71_03895, partial [Chitinophagales bacterium]|nr:hypothetical protein [Chitinophagales bacterium]